MSAIRFILAQGLCCSALAYFLSGNVFAAEVHPDDVVRAGVADLARAARAYRAAGEGDKSALEDDIRSFLARYADVHAAARLVLSYHWRDATPGQRDRFVAAYNNHVTRLLVDLVPAVDFGTVEIKPFTGDVEETPLMVQATFRTSEERLIHFALVIHRRNGHWRIFDVIAEGISYVKLYRNQFQGEISETGLEATIVRFEHKSTLGSVLTQQP